MPFQLPMIPTQQSIQSSLNLSVLRQYLNIHHAYIISVSFIPRRANPLCHKLLTYTGFLQLSTMQQNRLSVSNQTQTCYVWMGIILSLFCSLPPKLIMISHPYPLSGKISQPRNHSQDKGERERSGMRQSYRPDHGIYQYHTYPVPLRHILPLSTQRAVFLPPIPSIGHRGSE